MRYVAMVLGVVLLIGCRDSNKKWTPRGEPMKHERRVTEVAFSPDGKTVLTGSDDHTARLWGTE